MFFTISSNENSLTYVQSIKNILHNSIIYRKEIKGTYIFVTFPKPFQKKTLAIYLDEHCPDLHLRTPQFLSWLSTFSQLTPDDQRMKRHCWWELSVNWSKIRNIFTLMDRKKVVSLSKNNDMETLRHFMVDLYLRL